MKIYVSGYTLILISLFVSMIQPYSYGLNYYSLSIFFTIFSLVLTARLKENKHYKIIFCTTACIALTIFGYLTKGGTPVWFFAGYSGFLIVMINAFLTVQKNKKHIKAAIFMLTLIPVLIKYL